MNEYLADGSAIKLNIEQIKICRQNNPLYMQQRIRFLEQILYEIKKIINSPCIPTISSCIECKCSRCIYKQVLNIIDKTKEQ